MKKIVVAKFSSQYFDLESWINNWEINNLESLKAKIVYNLQKIFDWFNFEISWLVVVSSGAVRLGKLVSKLNWNLSWDDLIKNAVYASIWQPYLMQIWNEVFKLFSKITSQILVDYTHQEDRAQIAHLKQLMESLVKNWIIPIVNFNDSMSNEELKKMVSFVDNDKTFQFVMTLLKEIFEGIEIIWVIFSDKPLMRADSKGNLVWVCRFVDVGRDDKNEILNYCKWKSEIWTWWMRSKVNVAWDLVEKWIADRVVIAWKNRKLNKILSWLEEDITVFSR